jgi:hypothetical protein
MRSVKSEERRSIPSESTNARLVWNPLKVTLNVCVFPAGRIIGGANTLTNDLTKENIDYNILAMIRIKELLHIITFYQ